MRYLARIAREAVVSAIGHPVVSLVAIVMIAGMCAAVLLTQGRTVGAQQGVVDTLDEAGTRSIAVRAQQEAGLDTSVLTRLDGVSTIEWMGAFGPAVDAVNSSISGGTRVAVRIGHGFDLSSFGIPDAGIDGAAYASRAALQQLGMQQPAGSITTIDGAEYPVVDILDVPDQLAFLEPLLVVPMNPTTVSEGRSDIPHPVSILVVIAKDAADVADLTPIVQSVLNITDAQYASIETSAALAELRQIIDAQLAGVGQTLTVSILGLTAILVAAILTALVMMRRKDYGRRRALGASQRLIVGLVTCQTAILSTVGATVGGVTAYVALSFSNDPQPPFLYYVAVALLAAATGTLASLPPAVAAARRDPARELRVP